MPAAYVSKHQLLQLNPHTPRHHHCPDQTLSNPALLPLLKLVGSALCSLQYAGLKSKPALTSLAPQCPEHSVPKLLQGFTFTRDLVLGKAISQKAI